MSPTWRKPAGVLGILVYLTAWIVLIGGSDTIAALPLPVSMTIYLVAGIVWILPLGPALRWMETGRWRD